MISRGNTSCFSSTLWICECGPVRRGLRGTGRVVLAEQRGRLCWAREGLTRSPWVPCRNRSVPAAVGSRSALSLTLALSAANRLKV